MKISIQYKLLPLVVICVLLLSGLSTYIMVDKANKDIERYSISQIKTAQKTFLSIQDEEIKMLKATIISLSSNEEIRQAFIAQDRELLTSLTKEIHSDIKAESGLTHMIFYTPEKLFLRVHSPELYGEETRTRVIANKAMVSGSWGIGLEVGSRGYAQRVSYPYFDQEKIIGYIESGVKITPFMTIMKKQTNDDYIMFGLKEGFNAEKWAQTREASNLRNNYDDFNEYVVLGGTNEAFESNDQKCYTQEQLNEATEEGSIFNYFEENGREYVCGGFTITQNLGGEKAGTVVVIKDITNEKTATDKALKSMILIALVITIIISGILMMLIKFIVISPLKRLTSAAQELGDGNVNVSIPKISSNDEIKDMANTLETVVGAVKFLKGNKK